MGTVMSKAQKKRAYKAILAKCQKLWMGQAGTVGEMSTPDLVAIEKIVNKYLKRLS